MGPMTTIAIFLVVWWVVLFAVLPWGIVSEHEAGIKSTDGGDPGAPVNPNLKKKFLITTAIAVGITLIIWLVTFFRLIEIAPSMRAY